MVRAGVLLINVCPATTELMSMREAPTKPGIIVQSRRAYYNEFDKQKAAWLREPIARNLIAPGDVDERSILDVRPDDVRGYTQCHWFAGIGIWSYALRLAGWPDERPVWTGSCPCQPFSDAGKGEAFDDPRHLWPAWFPLIEARRPIVCFGEQVASADGLAWIDAVHADLDRAGYACGCVDLCAAGVGAPHRRQRLFFVADASRERSGTGLRDCGAAGIGRVQPGDDSGACELALPNEGRRRRRASTSEGCECDRTPGGRHEGDGCACGSGEVRGVAFSNGRHARTEGLQRSGQHGQFAQDGMACLLADSEYRRLQDGPLDRGGTEGGGGCGNTPTHDEPAASLLCDPCRPGPLNGFWRDADWIFCRDGKWRPIEPGVLPLAHGAPARVGRLRGYGDGICAPVAAAFVRAYMEQIAETHPYCIPDSPQETQ